MNTSINNDTDKEDYVNNVYKIYSSPEYIKILKESNYTLEEIKAFLDEIKKTSIECYDNLKKQQSRFLDLVLNQDEQQDEQKLMDKVNLNVEISKKIPSFSDKLNNDGPTDKLINNHINLSDVLSKKHILSSLSQSDYNNTMSF